MKMNGKQIRHAHVFSQHPDNTIPFSCQIRRVMILMTVCLKGQKSLIWFLLNYNESSTRPSKFVTIATKCLSSSRFGDFWLRVQHNAVIRVDIRADFELKYRNDPVPIRSIKQQLLSHYERQSVSMLSCDKNSGNLLNSSHSIFTHHRAISLSSYLQRQTVFEIHLHHIRNSNCSLFSIAFLAFASIFSQSNYEETKQQRTKEKNCSTFSKLYSAFLIKLHLN